MSTFPKSELLATFRCEPQAQLPCKLDWPIRRVRYWGCDPCDLRPIDETNWADIWGVRWQKESPDPRMTPFPVQHPLENNIDALDSLTWPDPDADNRFADLTHIKPNDEQLLIGDHLFAIYDRAWLLVGLQHLHELMMDQPEHIEALFERIIAFEIAIAQHYIDHGVEAAWIEDDYGLTNALAFSLEQWRRFVRPPLERLVNVYRSADLPVILHSKGNITTLVADLVEIGVDVLDPLQPNVNRLDFIREQTAGKMCLCGGIEASVLLSGDTAVTRTETHRRIGELGEQGGYIVGPDDNWDFPMQACDAMLDVVEEYRHRKGGHRR
jgi:uroporphyrinogen decarboxylase